MLNSYISRSCDKKEGKGRYRFAFSLSPKSLSRLNRRTILTPRVLREPLCLGALKGDPALGMVFFAETQVPGQPGANDRLGQPHGGGQPRGGGGVSVHDAQIHEHKALLHNAHPGQDDQQGDALAPLPFLFGLVHQAFPIICANRCRTVTSCSRVIKSSHMPLNPLASPPRISPVLTAHSRASWL